MHGDLHEVLHIISTLLYIEYILAIDFFLDFFDLVTKGKIEFEVLFDSFNAVHDGSVVFDADFGGDFVGAKI